MFNADMSLILKKAKINMMALGAFESNKSTKKTRTVQKSPIKVLASLKNIANR